MKYAFFILALLMLSKPVLPFLEYAFNYDYIAEVLCINKDKPELDCNGKCYLMQQLAKSSTDAETENSPESNRSIKIEFQLLYFEELKTPTINWASFPVTKKEDNFYKNSYKHLHTTSILRPPISFIV
ncbi:MAG: hypothetical protein ACTJGD_12010 [Mesonia hippocampi]|uniref:hypothetical protein n=1 Tax=Mesonia hippocampi TaxID=1628250 RepID=UPI003F98D5B7